MNKRRLKKPVKIILVLLLLLIGFLVIYNFELQSVNNNKELITFEVEEGSTYNSIAHELKEKNLIKSEFFYKIYIKLHHPSNLQVGIYELSSNMNVKKIVSTLNENAKSKYINLTFKEGINIKKIAKLIEENTKYTSDDVFNLLKDEEYINELINNYWFITDDIKDKNIYYSLEGYLFPDTYQITKDGTIKDIFKSMLDNMDKKLSNYKSDIENSKYSIHEILTMASIIELEASNSNDRSGVAGVFYNRLKAGWSLGSDVTTYYGIGVDLNERDLTQKDLNTYNGYNTRNSKLAGKLTVGPICIPGLESIKAAINPTNHNYYYFVADKHGKTYFSKTSGEHTNTVAKLKKDGLWYEY